MYCWKRIPTKKKGHFNADIAWKTDKFALKSDRYIRQIHYMEIQELVAEAMRKAGKTLATAESCTGGLIAHRITAMAGASDYYRGGVVAYSNEVKECALGVSHATLEAHGAVSEETVREMVEGVRSRLGADYAVATTGIAGPGGGTPAKPVGTVWIGIASEKETIARLLQLDGDRASIAHQTCNAVLGELLHMLDCRR